MASTSSRKKYAKELNKFNKKPIKILERFSTEFGKLIINSIWNSKVQCNSERKKKYWGFYSARYQDLKKYYN